MPEEDPTIPRDDGVRRRKWLGRLGDFEPGYLATKVDRRGTWVARWYRWAVVVLLGIVVLGVLAILYAVLRDIVP